MKEIIAGFLLVSLLLAGCAGTSAQGSTTLTSADITDEDLGVSDLSIDLSDDETALPEPVG